MSGNEAQSVSAKGSLNQKVSAKSVLGGIVAISGIWFFLGGGLEKQAAAEMKKIEHSVAADAAAQYEIAKRNGTPIDVCVAAGFVSAAYLQANDEANYAAAKKVETSDCAKAGLPQ